MTPHEGKRPGRPRIEPGADTVSRTVTLLPRHWTRAAEVGGGNASAGLRKIVDGYGEEEIHEGPGINWDNQLKCTTDRPAL